MKTIEIMRNQVAIVDDEDYEVLSAYEWDAKWNPKTHSFFAVSSVPMGGGKHKNIYMHEHLTCSPKEASVDHLNKSTLDNRRENLRVRVSGPIEIPGINWDTRRRMWLAAPFGYFNSYDEAIRAMIEALPKVAS